jgi:hypothetical protein
LKRDVGNLDFRFKFAGVTITISRIEGMSPSAGDMFLH